MAVNVTITSSYIIDDFYNRSGGGDIYVYSSGGSGTRSSGGGATSLASLSDVKLNTLSNEQSLTYESSTAKWINSDIFVKKYEYLHDGSILSSIFRGEGSGINDTGNLITQITESSTKSSAGQTFVVSIQDTSRYSAYSSGTIQISAYNRINSNGVSFISYDASSTNPDVSYGSIISFYSSKRDPSSIANNNLQIFPTYTSFGKSSLGFVNKNAGYLKIDSSGHLTLIGGATVWDDLVVPLTTSKQGTLSKPDFDYDKVAYMFPQNDPTEILYFQVQLPHKWAQGSRLYPHIHYCQTSTAKPTFKLDYKIANMGSSMPGAWKTYTMDSSVWPWVDSSTHQLAVGAGGIDASSYTISSMMLCKLYRDDNTVSGDVAAWQFDIHFEMDSLGSNKEYIK